MKIGNNTIGERDETAVYRVTIGSAEPTQFQYPGAYTLRKVTPTPGYVGSRGAFIEGPLAGRVEHPSSFLIGDSELKLK